LKFDDTIFSESSDFSVLRLTSSFKSNDDKFGSFKYWSGSGSYFGNCTLNCSKASIVTTQGDITVEKFFAKNGPNGTYSQA